MSKFRHLKRPKVEIENILPGLLKARRNELKISHKELAMAMDMTPVHMSAFFSGERSLTFRQLPQLCEILKVNVIIHSRTEVQLQPYGDI